MRIQLLNSNTVKVPGCKFLVPEPDEKLYINKTEDVPKHKAIEVFGLHPALFKRKYYSCNILKLAQFTLPALPKESQTN